MIRSIDAAELRVRMRELLDGGATDIRAVLTQWAEARGIELN
jgi:phosphotransferase system enzyme I (PtsP)